MTSIADIFSGKVSPGQMLTTQGWVRTRRDSKAGVSFVHLSDGSCFSPLQIVIPQSLVNYTSEILRLTTGCSLQVQGVLVESQGKGQSLEIQAQQVTVLGWVEDPDTYPLSPKRHTLEHLRDYAHLRPRSNVISAAMRIRHTASQAIHRCLHQLGFFWVHTPILTASDCEGAGQLFRVTTLDLTHLPQQKSGEIDMREDFFGQNAYLTVSGQLNLETYCEALSKVYSFGPTFRAENSNTARHLAEFWMVEPEIAFATLDDNAVLAETLLKSVIQTVLDERADDIAFFAEHIDPQCAIRLENVINKPFERLDYAEAIRILEQSNRSFEFSPVWGLDLQTEHERYLSGEYVGGPVIVMNYPKEIKGFYMYLNDDNATVAAMDVLVPEMGEIIGGSQREDRLPVLQQRLKELGLEEAPYQWYLDLRRYGTVPHAGFGLGLERLVSYLTGLTNVRDVIPFPRTPKNIRF